MRLLDNSLSITFQQGSFTDQLAARGSLQSLAEDDDVATIPLLLQMFGSQVVVTDVTLVGDIDIPATNGVVHTIDEVLTIPNACLADAECSAWSKFRKCRVLYSATTA